jgi:hypothetical protein
MRLNRQVNLLRIVVASPGDVQGERDALPELIAEINRNVAADRNQRLELSRWETDTYPGFHTDGPQGGIDPILKIEDCDLLLGIFWRRFGTPTTDAGSGTEHEFKLAYQTWQKKDRPQLMVYFNQKAYTPQSKEETDQWGKVLEFRSNFPKEGLWWPYKGKAEFISLVRNHLTQYVRNLKLEDSAGAARPHAEQKLEQEEQTSPKPAHITPSGAPAAANLSPAQKLKLATLEKQLAILLEQYTAVSNRLLYETNPATKVVLQEQAEVLLQEYDKKQTELEQLKLAGH